MLNHSSDDRILRISPSHISYEEVRFRVITIVKSIFFVLLLLLLSVVFFDVVIIVVVV